MILNFFLVTFLFVFFKEKVEKGYVEMNLPGSTNKFRLSFLKQLFSNCIAQNPEVLQRDWW